MKALVTGANGLIGANLVRELLAQGYEVRAFVRSTSDLSSLTGLPIELCNGDVLAAETLHTAVEGCDLVFHAAGVFAYWGVSNEDLETTAVQGTLNVLEACNAAHIRRVILTSSSVVFGSSNRPILRDETFELHEQDVPAYILTKRKQEKVAFRRAMELELELVAVCPTIVVGPYDVHLSPSNSIILTYLNDPFRLTFPGGCNIVSAYDIARGHILAAQRGKNGERYLLGSENLEWSVIHRMISELCGVPGPFYSANHTSSYLAATVAELTAWLTGQRPLTTRTQATMVGRYYWYRHDRISALGFSPQPARLALADAIGWLAASKHVSQDLRVTLQLSREVYAVRSRRLESERKGEYSL
jgi:dihydroflavonol-4-reductase